MTDLNKGDVIQINPTRSASPVKVGEQTAYLHDNVYNNYSSLIHEDIHIEQSANGAKKVSTEMEIEAYIRQMLDDSFYKTTIEYKIHTLNNFANLF